MAMGVGLYSVDCHVQATRLVSIVWSLVFVLVVNGASVLTVTPFPQRAETAQDEVSFLLRLLEGFQYYIGQLHANDVMVKVIGRRTGLPASHFGAVSTPKLPPTTRAAATYRL